MTTTLVQPETSELQPDGTQKTSLVIEPSRGLAALKLPLVWQYRELLYFMVWREIKVRYKQTILGVVWIVLQPVVSMVMFTLLFGVLLEVPTEGTPYPIFVYCALLPWQYFAGALGRSSSSLVDNAQLISKIYFPRLLVPISRVLSGLVDFGVAFLILIALMAYYQMTPTWGVILLPIFILLAVITALGFSLWLSALNVRFRDINYLVPFLIQMWMYATPVIYSSSLIPERFRFLLSLNPMTGVVEGFRWALLGAQSTGGNQASVPLVTISVIIPIVVLLSGVVFFRTTERTFADIV